jgi:hypothetical protein
VDKCGNIKKKLIWHIFFFKVHLLAHQRRDGAGVGVERLCSRWRSLLVPSGVKSGRTAAGDPASGEDTKTLLGRRRRSCFGDDVDFGLFYEVFHQGAVLCSDEKSVRRRGNEVEGVEDFQVDDWLLSVVENRSRRGSHDPEAVGDGNADVEGWEVTSGLVFVRSYGVDKVESEAGLGYLEVRGVVTSVFRDELRDVVVEGVGEVGAVAVRRKVDGRDE